MLPRDQHSWDRPDRPAPPWPSFRGLHQISTCDCADTSGTRTARRRASKTESFCVRTCLLNRTRCVVGQALLGDMRDAGRARIATRSVAGGSLASERVIANVFLGMLDRIPS